MRNGIWTDFSDDDQYLDDDDMSLYQAQDAVCLYASSRGILQLFSEKDLFYIKKSYNLTSDSFNSDPDIAIMYIEREIKALTELKHPTVIQMIGYSTNIIDPNIKVDLATGGSLMEVLIAEDKGVQISGWDTTQKFIVMYGIARALSFITDKEYIYRDLKPDNILLDHDLRPLLSDFDSAKKFEYKKKPLTGIGTTEYCAPEQLQSLISNDVYYGNEATVYSFGAVIYSLFTLLRPYYHRISEEVPECNQVKASQILSKELNPPKFDDDFIYPELQDFTENLLSWDPAERLGIQDLHEIIYEIAWNIDELDSDRFDKYVNYLNFYEQTPESIPLDGTPENLKIAESRQCPLALRCASLISEGLAGTCPNISD
ncbi:hypothetical protein TRFO_40541 [Tritrichomonas foetus]|uniref:Protein kinase domain-containing protein n=1 Tax=Tritrichomonas foetus TaxID=1144522 RepID=A0A1J4J4R7_9EUKA|nr:hypothetical protein TRFO_40541 [Tritrichomonas foetus]|eukprot:OHS93135.1 hypothetical protein TRFO_40541 [Tritrichomonas foetus]